MTLIVDKVDVERGVVTLRSPTTWERVVHAASHPIRWLRSKFGPRVHTVVTPASVSLADPGDAWNFRAGERVAIPDPWRDES